MHGYEIIHVKPSKTAYLQIIENFWAKYEQDRMFFLSTSHSINKNGKILRNKPVSSVKLTLQKKFLMHILVESTLHIICLLLRPAIYITSYTRSIRIKA